MYKNRFKQTYAATLCLPQASNSASRAVATAGVSTVLKRLPRHSTTCLNWLVNLLYKVGDGHFLLIGHAQQVVMMKSESKKVHTVVHI